MAPEFFGAVLKNCVKVEVAVLGSPSLISLMVSVNVRQHWEGGKKEEEQQQHQQQNQNKKREGGLEGGVIDDDDDELMLNVLRCHLTY